MPDDFALDRAHPAVDEHYMSELTSGPMYGSVLVVRNDSHVTALEHLRGATFAFNDDQSLSGYFCMVFALCMRGHSLAPGHQEGDFTDNTDLQPERHSQHKQQVGEAENERQERGEVRAPFFSEAFSTGGHSHSIDAIIAGRATTAAIDIQVIRAMAMHEDPRLEQIKLLENPPLLGPYPSQPFVVLRSMSPGLKAQLRDALCALPVHVLKQYGWKQMVPVDPGTYAMVEGLMHRATTPLNSRGSSTRGGEPDEEGEVVQPPSLGWSPRTEEASRSRASSASSTDHMM